MSALNAALCRRGIILWLAAVLLLASRSTHSAPVYDQDTTQIAEYDAATAGCYFNFQRYQEGDRIMTSEPCLNCTCHNRMLMCYLKVCPFTKAIGQDCTVEKRPDQCCPVITCPEVPVQLLTSTSAPAGLGPTEVGFHDNYGCHVDERFYADGAMLPVDYHNPCELCYCIRNRTTCVMQECTLRVAGCKPVYQPGVCCPIKYDCEYDEESSTTVGPTPGLIMTTTLPPGVLPQCYYEDKVYEDGDLINSSQPCQHCYCFHGEIACAVQNCGTPMQAHGKNCTALPPPEGECCPTTYQCEEDEQGILMLPEEERLPEQTPHEEQIMTESPMIIDQEDQQVKDEHPQEETFPGADNAIPLTPEGEEEKGVQGTIEHVTKEQISTTEKLEKQPATSPTEETIAPEIKTTTAEKESTPPLEHDTEVSSAAVTLEELATTKVPSEIEITKTEAPISEQTEESLITEMPIAKLPEVSSISEGLPQEEAITTEHISEEHISTEENILEKEHSTPIAEIPEISTEIIEKPTSPIAETEESGIVPESTTEQIKEDKSKMETTSGETLATETEPSVEKETVTAGHEVPSTEQTETEEPQLTEVSPKEQPTEEEQKPVTDKNEQYPKLEQPTSEHAIIKEEPATVGAKKEDFGLTESPDISKEPVTIKERVEEESTPEILTQGPTGIPIPERSPGQKAEDENIYHVTDDYGVTRPEVSSDNLLTKPPEKTPTTYLPQEEEIPSKETQKPIEEEDLEVPKEIIKPILEKVTEINLSTQREPEITEITTEETKAETIPAITKTETSTETAATTIAAVEYKPEKKVPEEIEKPSVSEEPETEIPEGEIQSTEKIPSDEEIPTKGLEVSGESSSSEEVSSEQGEKKVQPKKEQPSEEEAGTQFPAIELETPVFIPGQEHSTLPSLGEQPTEGEVTTVSSSTVQSTQVPQIEEKTEIVTVEEGKQTTGKPVEEHITEQPIASPDVISSEEEKELQTTESTLKEEQTTEIGEKSTTQVSAGEERKTEQPEQYSTEKALEEPTVTQEVEGAEGLPTKIAEQTEATIIKKEPSAETEVKPTDIIETQQTELPAIVDHPTKIDEAEKEGEEKVPAITEIQTEISATEIGSTEAPILEQQTEKIQTEPSVTGGLPSQPSVPLDRKEDQESVEPIPHEKEQEGQITQKPSLDQKEVSEIYEESQKTTIPSEVTHVPPSEEIITESVPPEEKPTEIIGTTESISASEEVTQPHVKQPEVTSVQPEVETKSPEQEEQTQEPIIKEQPEGVTIETTSITLTSETSEKPVTGKIDEGKSTAETTASEGTTISGLISEVSTESVGPIEEHTESEIPTERQPETHEETTQSSTTEEKPSEGKTEEISPKVPTEQSTETPEISILEKQPQEEKEIVKESTEIPEHEVHSTLAPEETPQVVTTEVSQHSTELPTEKEYPTEKESIPEITLRPSGIPGEGNCLVEGQSYNNNSAVPPANFCQTSCRCVSSIVQCELVQCSAPPTHSNCMPVYGAEQCCPIYACGETNIAELESDSHKVESPATEGEEQKITPTTELLTEAPVTETTVASKEFSTVVAEISTPESQPAEITVSSLSPSEEEIIEKQLTTESVEQTTTIRPIEQHPEEHTISPVFETSQEPITQVPEKEEHTVSEESITKGETGETVTKLTVSTEQPIEEQSTVSGEEQQVITSTNIPPEEELHATGEGDLKEEVTISTASAEQETSSSAEIETSTSAERGQISTIAPSKEEESTTEIIEQETLGKKDVKEQSTFKPIAEDKIEQPKEEKIKPISTSEEPITKEHETSIKPEKETVTEKLPAIPEVLEEQTTVRPSEYESTSVSEIQLTTEQKPKETEYKEEKEQETVTTEGEQAVETEIPESQTKLPTTIASDKVEEPIELTTLVQYAPSEAPSEDNTTAKSEEVFIEESKGETKPTIATEIPGIEEEHTTTPGLASETPSEELAKPIEESIPEISQKEASSETVGPTEGIAGIETTEHPGEHPELTVSEGKPSVTKLPTELTEPSVHEPESTQVSIKEHPEITPETESHTSELPKEQTILEEVLTTSALPESEQPTKETAPSLSEEQTEQSVIPEVETPVIKEEHVITTTEEQTPKSVEQVSVEEQTVVPATSSEGEATEQITPESVTIQEEQKITDSVKPETELPILTEEQTAGPETHKEKEEQKPETEIKEEPVTTPKVTEVPKEETTEGVTPVDITEGHLSVEEHIPQEEATPSTVETDVISQQPIEITTVQEEQSSEEEGQVTSEISLPQHPSSEETTSQIFEEHPAVSTERLHEYETTSIAEEEVSKPVTEISVEKLSPEKELATTQGLKPEEPVTRISEISPTEKPTEALPETEKPVQQEQETELPEKDETTTKPVESITSEEKLPEELEAEVKPTEVPVSEEEAPSTASSPIEATSVQTEEQPSLTKLQPTEQYLPSLPPQEIQPTQSEESDKAHTSLTEEEQPKPQKSTTEKLPEIEQTESPLETTVSTEGPIKISGDVPAELPEEKTTIRPSPEEFETQAPLKPEEGPQMAVTPEEVLIKTQSTESPSESTESLEIPEIPEEEVSSQESEEGSHEQPGSVDTSHFNEDGGSYLTPDEDYDEDDQIYGPGTCRYGGKVYVSAQQIPRDDPCDFCFCFRSDIICLQQSCPPPIPGCHEEPISGFCCPRYECPVSMATAVNFTTTTTTTTTTLPPHFHAHAYKGAARRSGCQIDGHAYRVGQIITSQSGPCTRCICRGDGKMNCEPLLCSPEPMLKQMIAAATAKKRR